MNTQLYIPPPNIRVRIISSFCQRAFYSNPDGRFLGVIDMAAIYDDQYWYIIPGSGNYKGTFKIQNAYSNRKLYLSDRGDWHGETNTTDVGEYADQYFTFEQGTGAKAGQFRIVCPATNRVLFSRFAEPTFGSIGSGQTYADHWFTFQLEPLDLVSVDYQTEAGNILSSRLVALASQQKENNSDVAQEQTYTIRESTEEESTFESEVGLELGVTTEVKCGVPMLAEGKIEISATAHSNLKWGTANRTTKEWQAEIKLSVPPHSKGRVTATILKSVMVVPFTSTWKSKSTGNTMVTTGVYKGVACADFKTTDSVY